jgi:hypothetical protein
MAAGSGLLSSFATHQPLKKGVIERDLYTVVDMEPIYPPATSQKLLDPVEWKMLGSRV